MEELGMGSLLGVGLGSERESRILAIRWEGEFIAWANSIGVKVYDCNLKQRITHLKRPQSSLDTTHQPQLCWANGRTLLIGWADSVQAVEVRQRDKSQAAMGLPVNYVTVVCQFTLPDAICCGIAPHGQDLAVLFARLLFRISHPLFEVLIFHLPHQQMPCMLS